jgi:ATP-dependent helicase/nuclease subunit B
MISGIQQQKYSYLESKQLNIKKALYLEKLVKCSQQASEHLKIEFHPPNPELQLRPNKFSATDLDLLKNNSYVFYAKKILRLKELNHINEFKNIRGNYVHKALDIFIKKSDSENDIHKIAKNTIKNMWLDPTYFGIWFFRLKNIFSFVVENVKDNVISFSEIKGECSIHLSQNYSFNIFCIADRVDILEDNTLAIIDYKTGSLPSLKQVEYGYKPQLPIEALIAKNDGFGIGKTAVSSLHFWLLSGSKTAGEIRTITANQEKTNELIEKTLTGLKNLIHQYNVIGVPYDININYEYDQSYAHLARLKEWHDA